MPLSDNGPRYSWREPGNQDGFAGVVDHPLLDQILDRRGIRSAAEARHFLQPCHDHLNDPFGLPDIEPAIERIKRALATSETIVIHGDYDADGLTSSAMLARALRSLGAPVEVVIPRRLEDGYGVSDQTIDQVLGSGAKLLITVDCGSADAERLARIHDAGIDTIVLDHHHVSDRGLPAGIVVSPQRPDSAYPFPDLAAAGVVYQVLRALLGDEAAAVHLPLAALGTVADVVPLVGDNRIIVHQGLAQFKRGPLGLQALAIHAGINDRLLTSWQLAFVLGPRINAAGRMGDPRKALDLLLTDDVMEAGRLATHICRLNTWRQQESARALAEAMDQLDARGSTGAPLLLVSGPWNVGLVGLIAGKLCDHYNRPAIALAEIGASLRGSARSIDGFSIAEALESVGDILQAHGGHSRAGGLTIEAERLGELEERLCRLVDQTFPDGIAPPELLIDAELHPSEVSTATIDLLSALEPFGAGNEQPVFLLRSVTPVNQRPSRDGRHLLFSVRLGRRKVDAVCFNRSSLGSWLPKHDRIDLAFHLRRDRWNGRERVSLEVVDARPSTARPSPAE